jgi:hypothetical protein
MLLALKTTKQGYHLYTQGERNHHPAHKQMGIINIFILFELMPNWTD